MLKRILMMGFCTVLLASGATAGPEGTGGHDMMMKEMSNCAICKHMVGSLDVLGPVMTMDAVRLNDGFVMVQGVSDAAMLDQFRATHDEMAKAGEACMTMTDDQAASDLCGLCQGIRGAMAAGARMSQGNTAMGCMMVLTSDEPAVQDKISEVATMCEMMLSSM